ncbi:hypothetical protein PMAYCL1PPCAC_22821, partial [Pristionchus mayeri]
PMPRYNYQLTSKPTFARARVTVTMDFLEDNLYMLDFEDDFDYTGPSSAQTVKSQSQVLPPEDDTNKSDAAFLSLAQQIQHVKESSPVSGQSTPETTPQSTPVPSQVTEQSAPTLSSKEDRQEKSRKARYLKLRAELKKYTCPPLPLLDEAARAFLELTEHLNEDEEEEEDVARSTKPTSDSVAFPDPIQAVNMRMDALEKQFASIAPPSQKARGESELESRTEDYDLLSEQSMDGPEKDLAEARQRIAQLEREKEAMTEKYNELVKTMMGTVMNAMK